MVKPKRTTTEHDVLKNSGQTKHIYSRAGAGKLPGGGVAGWLLGLLRRCPSCDGDEDGSTGGHVARLSCCLACACFHGDVDGTGFGLETKWLGFE